VSGDVNKSESNALEIQEGKPEVNRNAAALFFFQAIRIGSRESLDQSGFAMVDMPGGANDHMFNVFHEGNVICTMMLAKAAAAGQMTEHKKAV
jgi:hypothetical protein